MPAERKDKIADAFLALLRQGPLDKIRVKGLIQACGVSRQTFYYHFKDLMDVLEYALRRSSRHLTERCLQAPDRQAMLRCVVDLFADNTQLLQKALNSQRRTQIELFLLEAVEKCLLTLAPRCGRGEEIPYADRAALLRYSAGGLLTLLLSHCEQPELDRDQLARQLSGLLSGNLAEWRPI